MQSLRGSEGRPAGAKLLSLAPKTLTLLTCAWCLFWQAVKARVLSLDTSPQRLRLSLAPKSAATEGAVAGADTLGGLTPGDVVEGAVRSITMSEVRTGCPCRFRTSGMLKRHVNRGWC